MTILSLKPGAAALSMVCLFLGLARSASMGSETAYEFRISQRIQLRLRDAPSTNLAKSSLAPWLRASPDGTASVQLGRRIVLQLQDPPRLREILARGDLKLARKIGDDIFILEAQDAQAAVRHAHEIARSSGVVACYPVMRRTVELHSPYAERPTDAAFQSQWPLENRSRDGSPAGVDLNLRAAWPLTCGEGITIAVADSGIEMEHPELKPALVGAPHHNFFEHSTNAGPVAGGSAAAHGTMVAGLAAASLGDARMVGVAPGARLASWVIFDETMDLCSDEDLMDLYQFQSNSVAVQNHSWAHGNLTLTEPTLLEAIGLSNAFYHGRSGKGVILVKSAGNGREAGANANDDAHISDPHIIAVAAARKDGCVASYSTPGACLLVAGPSGDVDCGGLFTTDLIGVRGKNPFNFYPPYQDYSNYVFDSLGFSGTSAAAPQIAGVAALILSANPRLAIRDVQQILILSSRHFAPDPDLTTNAAGFAVSHNLGFGIPDAGFAVRLAKDWVNRPAAVTRSYSWDQPFGIPDAGLQVAVCGIEKPFSMMAMPSVGLQPDVPTAELPLIPVGRAIDPIEIDLRGAAALIERGDATFAAKIQNAADAGAVAAIIYNFPDDPEDDSSGEALMPLGGTQLSSIPALFIGNLAGRQLEFLLGTDPSMRVQLKQNSASCVFTVKDTLLCEHVSLRIRSDHPCRGDLRITLVSPSGVRSVLQRYNADVSPGPVDWTYYSTHHFFESSAGVWTAYFTDESFGKTGTISSAALEIGGVEIQDEDADGLDDMWELAWFQNLDQGPKDDPDHDGLSNMHEQILLTNPTARLPVSLDLGHFTEDRLRLSWPSSASADYDILAGPDAASLKRIETVHGTFPETTWFPSCTNAQRRFYRIVQLSSSGGSLRASPVP